MFRRKTKKKLSTEIKQFNLTTFVWFFISYQLDHHHHRSVHWFLGFIFFSLLLNGKGIIENNGKTKLNQTNKKIYSVNQGWWWHRDKKSFQNQIAIRMNQSDANNFLFYKEEKNFVVRWTKTKAHDNNNNNWIPFNFFSSQIKFPDLRIFLRKFFVHSLGFFFAANKNFQHFFFAYFVIVFRFSFEIVFFFILSDFCQFLSLSTKIIIKTGNFSF